MSDQDRTTIIGILEKRGKKFVVWYGFIRTIVVLVAVFLMLERKGAEILATPALQKATAVKLDSVSLGGDAVHIKQNGYFSTLFQHVDTIKHKFHFIGQ